MRALRLAVLAVAFSSPLAAQSPIQIALFTPIQIVPEGKAVKGLRLNFIYSRNTAVMGVDLGLVSMNTGTAKSGGINWSAVTIVKGPFTGWQSGLLASTEGRFVGLQSGLVSMARESEGLQWSFVNSSWNHRGLQLAVVNYARRTSGVQVGLVNIIKQGGQFPIFPIVNWGK